MRPQRPVSEERVAELVDFLKQVRDAQEYRRALCVLLRVTQKMTAEDVSSITGYHPNRVRIFWSAFIDRGVEGLRRHPTKRCRAYLSPEEEKELLDNLVEKARQGHIPVAGEIQKALEEKLGHSIHKATLYRFLKRNNWRKVVPRPVHPKNNPEQAAAFKKNFRRCSMICIRQQKTPGGKFGFSFRTKPALAVSAALLPVGRREAFARQSLHI